MLRRCRLEGAQTYLQSGNVVFESAECNRDTLTTTIEAAIEQAFGFHSNIVLRDTRQMREIIAANPFANRAGLDPAKLLVLFLAASLSPAETLRLAALDSAPEEISLVRTEIFIYYPEGMGRSKLNPVLAKALKTTNTGRNWSSVTNILALMENMEVG